MTAVVMIGASAGGVPALMQLCADLPADFPAPVLVVLHVGARHSLLPTLLASASPMPARHAENGERLMPGHIYVAPPDHHLLIEDGRAVLTRGPKENHSRPAIDPLFRSGALAYGTGAIGVVLTGMLDDGTAGLQAIKHCGGIAVVQDPQDAVEPSMPASALRYVEVDHCVPLALMPMLLASLVRRGALAPAPMDSGDVVHEHEITRNTGAAMEHLKAIARPSTYTCPECHGDLWEILDSRPKRFRCHTGHAYTTRALQQSLAESEEQAVWSAMRALQERRTLLGDMAAQQRALERGEDARKLEAIAERLEGQITVLRSLLEEAPPPIE